MLHVNHVIADLQVAEIGKKCRDFGFLALGTSDHRIRFVEQITRAQDGQIGFRKHDAVGHVSLGQSRSEQLAREVRSFVGIAFAAAGAAAQTKGNGVLAEDVGQTLDFAGVGNGDQNPLAVRNQLLDFLEHGRNRAVEAGCGLGLEGNGGGGVVAAIDFKMLDIGSWQAG